MVERPASPDSPVYKAIISLREEHGTIMRLVERMTEAKDAPTLAPILEELHGLLMKHFAHEEYPDGLYHRMGALTSEHREDLRELVDQHFAILSALRGMVERSRRGADPALFDEATALAERLREHETKEHSLAAKLSA